MTTGSSESTAHSSGGYRPRETEIEPPVHIFTCDLEGRVEEIYFNSKYSTVYENPKRYLGGTDFDWLKRSDAEAAMAIKQRCVIERRTVHDSFTCQWDGKLRNFSMTVVPDFTKQGELERVFCFVVDITEGVDQITNLYRPQRSRSNLWSTLGVARGSLRFPGRRWFGSPRSETTTVEDDTHSQIEGLVLDANSHAVRGALTSIHLTRIEWRLLQELIRHRGHVVSHDALLEAVWGPGYGHAISLLHDTVSRLRHRLREAGTNQAFIQTVHGVGYRFV